MTLNAVADELASCHHGQVIMVLERLNPQNRIYLASNLRELLGDRGAALSSHDPGGFKILTRSAAEVRVYLATIDDLSTAIRGHTRETPVFTESRTGWYQGTVGDMTR